MKLFLQFKQYLPREKLNLIKLYIKNISQSVYQLLKTYSHKLNKRQKIASVVLASVIVFVLLIVTLVHHRLHYEEKAVKSDYPVNFETQPVAPVSKQTAEMQTLTDKHEQLASQLSQLTDVSSEQYQSVKHQLETLQTNMASLASQQDVKQLQQTLQTPNTQLLTAVNGLQTSVQTVIKQTAKKSWVEAKTVEHYFRLVAVQGFSDGMRVIIDVDGNQTVLSQNQVCRVCRGWVLHSMDFTNQSAVFTKKENDQMLYAKLQAN
ncbi:MAG: hypothetical protein K2Q14_04780 [Gammaproteobacteria bacterium]|nr:hypothetical protein [Gammaproteobacteria bacterium]MBY0544847.1 hypothetical protein [Gammaproteobacteria bacterium]